MHRYNSCVLSLFMKVGVGDIYMRKYIILTVVLLVKSFILIGCNNNDKQEPIHDQEAGYNEVKNLTFLEAIEEYPIWIRTGGSHDDVERTDKIVELHYFKDGKVTIYYRPWEPSRKSIEEIRDLSVQEIIDSIESGANYNEIEEHEIKYTFILDSTGQSVEEVKIIYSGDRDTLTLYRDIISQPLYEKRLAGFKITRDFAYFTIIEDEFTRIRLGDAEDGEKENVTIK